MEEALKGPPMNEEAQNHNKAHYEAGIHNAKMQEEEKKLNIFQKYLPYNELKKNYIFSIILLIPESLLGGLIIMAPLMAMTGIKNLKYIFPPSAIIYFVLIYLLAERVGRYAVLMLKKVPFQSLRVELLQLESTMPLSYLVRAVITQAKNEFKKAMAFYIGGLLLVIALCIARDYFIDQAGGLNWIMAIILLILNPFLYTVSCYLALTHDAFSEYKRLKKEVEQERALADNYQSTADEHMRVFIDLYLKAQAENEPILKTAEITTAFNRYQNQERANKNYYTVGDKSVDITVKNGGAPAENIAVAGYFEDGRAILTLTDKNGHTALTWDDNACDHIKRVVIHGCALPQLYFKAGSKVLIDLVNLNGGGATPALT